MNKSHTHAALIKAWADGAEIQDYDEELGCWCNTGPTPVWNKFKRYRIKPTTIKYRLWLEKQDGFPPKVKTTSSEDEMVNFRCDFGGWLGGWQEVEV